MFSVLNINKPSGMTSHDVVNQLRRIYGLKKIGHLGTLDPLATGVLPVCLGQATRLIEYFPSDKSYRAWVQFGITTSTLDGEGEELTRTPSAKITRKDVEALLPQFTGTIEQRVPMHSAVHVQGKKLYEYAHQGKTVETPIKTVTIFSFELNDWDTSEPDFPVAVLDIHCASGTYVRALARDLGEQLGCGAYLKTLSRTTHGHFKLEDAVLLDTLENTEYPEQYLQHPGLYLDLPVVDLESEEIMTQVCHGMKVRPTEPLKLKGNSLCYLQFQREPVAVASYEDKQFRPVKVFKSLDD